MFILNIGSNDSEDTTTYILIAVCGILGVVGIVVIISVVVCVIKKRNRSEEVLIVCCLYSLLLFWSVGSNRNAQQPAQRQWQNGHGGNLIKFVPKVQYQLESL